MKQYPSVMAPLFLHSLKGSLSKEFFKNTLKPIYYSINDASRREKEAATFIHFMDFIDECEDGTAITEDGRAVTHEDILTFFTGADRPPPLGFQPKPTLHFSDAELASAQTCDMGLSLPICHKEYKTFKEKFMLSSLGHDGFGMT